MNNIVISTIFNCLSGNFGLTEEFIYSKIIQKETRYAVLSSSTMQATRLGFIPTCTLKNNKTLKVFEGKQGILIVRNGRAGQMNFLESGKYTINDHAYIFYLRETFKNKYKIKTQEDEKNFLLWYICMYQSKAYEYASSSDNATWNKGDFLKLIIDIPDIEYRNNITKLYGKCLNFHQLLQKSLQEIYTLQSKNINAKNIDNKGDIHINQLLKYVSRNDALSEEGIYHRLPEKGDKEPIKVLSGSSDYMYYGLINSKTPKIHYIDKKQCLHVVSRGNAGKITYLQEGKYATNTNAFLFYLIPDIRNKAQIMDDTQEQIYLKFLRIYLQPIFYHASSESDLSVFPLTELMKDLQIPFFVYSKHMKDAVQEWDKLDSYANKLELISKQLDTLLSKQIV